MEEHFKRLDTFLSRKPRLGQGVYIAEGAVVLGDVKIGLIITDLCVLDFGGPDHQVRLVSLHPGVSVEQVQENTGFAVHIPDSVSVTAAPTAQQLAIIAEMEGSPSIFKLNSRKPISTKCP